MSFRRDGVWPPTPTDVEEAPFSTRMPFTTSTGSLDSETLFEPRILMRVPVPVVPPLACTSTPGTVELSASERFETGAFAVRSARSMLCATVPCSRIAWSPVAVTTTASRPMGTAAIAKFNSAEAPAETETVCVTVPYPMYATRTVCDPDGTLAK